MRRYLTLLAVLVFLGSCASRSFIPEPVLAPPDVAVQVQYLLPPTFADDYDVLPEPAPFADEKGFLVALRPRGGTATITIAGGSAARKVWEQYQPDAGSNRVKKTVLRGVQGIAIFDPDLITMAWVVDGAPYFVSVTTADDKKVQIFINALAVYDKSTWQRRVLQ